MLRIAFSWAERDRNGEWRTATYAQMRASARNVAQALLDRPLSAERPIAILSGNDIEHAALGARRHVRGHSFCADLAGLFAGLVRFRKAAVDLRHSDAGPGFCVSRARRSARRSKRCCRRDAELVISGDPAGLHATPFSVFETTAATSAVDRAHAAVGPDTIAKFLFTSGSTGTPKGVDQHAAHAVQQSGNRPHHAAVRGGRSAGAVRLAAVEPHLRGQSRLRAGAVQRRLVLHR